MQLPRDRRCSDFGEGGLDLVLNAVLICVLYVQVEGLHDVEDGKVGATKLSFARSLVQSDSA